MLRLPFEETAIERLETLLETEVYPEEIGFIILEHFQGEGGYRFASDRMVKGIYTLAKKYRIPYIADEIQAGLGRTGKWWSFEHYGIIPDVFTSGKALQVAAVVANKSLFPKEPGAISSTWGGGHILDLAIGIKTIEIIKKQKLLDSNVRMGQYCLKALKDLKNAISPRGRGLMMAFDLNSKAERDKVIAECVKNGLVLLGCGSKGIRIIPPYVVEKEDIDNAIAIIEKATVRNCKKASV